jgi:hypothetical protein
MGKRKQSTPGLDGEFWVVLDVVFTWPGFDLRPIKSRNRRVDYAYSPPRFFDELIDRIRELDGQGDLARTSRDKGVSLGGAEIR